MEPCFLGIDTSNYTTSVALVDVQGNVLFDKRIVLTVKPGEIGLRQSDAFYQHVMNLPGIFFDLPSESLKSIKGIGVSTRPRNVEGSYMPVFNAGHQFAKVIGKSLDCPIYEYAHQDGHVMAALDLKHEIQNQKILNLHISGGTTEIFNSRWSMDKFYFDTEIIGGTKDISIGQLIDRLGVYMGYPFPCGNHMEKAVEHLKTSAINHSKILPLKSTDGWFNLSGIENKGKQLLAEGMSKEAFLVLLFNELGAFLLKLLKTAIEKEKPDCLILAGGVMSNFWIREQLRSLLDLYPTLEIQMTPAKLCTDNAVGIAKMLLRRG